MRAVPQLKTTTRNRRHGSYGRLILLVGAAGGLGLWTAVPSTLPTASPISRTSGQAVTARRRREMGQDVRILDPFGVVGGRDSFNPLELIDTGSPDAIDDARMVADMMVAVDVGVLRPSWVWR